MTVNTATSTAGPYAGNGVTTVFSVPFYWLVDTDLKVSKMTAATGLTTVLTLNSDYTLTGAGNTSGGSLTMAVAPLTGDQIYVERNLALVQLTSYPSNSPFPASSHEKALDRDVMGQQQLASQIGRALIGSVFSATYDLTGRTLINTGTATNGNDVPGLAQVQQIAAGSASGIIPSLIATYTTLGGTGGAGLLGFQQLGTGAILDTVNNVLQERISVKRFGAKGDGVTDDGPAIQKATTYAASVGKDLFFPAGTYRLLTFVVLPSNTRWVGEIASVIFLDPAMTLGASLGGSQRGLYASVANNVSFENLTFQSQTTGLTKQITVCMNQVTSLRVTNCVFQNFGNGSFYAQGLVIFQSTDVRVTRSRFLGNSGDGCAIGSNSTKYEFTNCEFSNNGDWGLACTINANQGTISGCLFLSNTSTATGADRCTDVTFSHNVMIGNAQGVRVCKFAADANVNHRITIVGNTINNSGTQGISVETMAAVGVCTVIGNVISGSSGSGINVSDSSGVVVMGNSINSCVGVGIVFSSFTSGFETGRCSVVGNKIDSCSYGVQQNTGAGTTSKITIVGNDITNVTNLSLSVVTADYIDGANANYFDFNKPINLPSALASSSASAGGIAPVAVWQYFPIYIGGSVKKIAVYNP